MDLSAALSPRLKNFTPKMKDRGLNPCLMISATREFMNKHKGCPSSWASVAPPKKHYSTTLENILVVRLMTSYSTMCSPFF
jgi:hypothetical protein